MNEVTADFIRAHADDDVRQLALKGTKDPGVDLTFALDQIAGRQTARRKLPSWAAADGVVFPPHLSMEQCSSEPTARYKRRMVDGDWRKENGEGLRVGASAGMWRMVDLTGGFGVDFSFMAPAFDEAVYVERQSTLCEIARHNFKILGIKAEVVCCDGVEYLRQMPHANLIYIDPARRDDHGQRTYGMSDCTPDVIALRDLLLEKADRVLIKLSPMLDWSKAVQDLSLSPTTHHPSPCVREVHIVSVGNECKELLLVLENRGVGRENEGPTLFCVNDDTVFTVTPSPITHHPSPNTQHPSPITHHPSPITHHLLYEPNASIMKAGCFAEVADAFGLSQLAPNSHLFMGDTLVDSFPGRMFEVERVTTLNKRDLREALSGLTQANISVRNFPLSVAQLRQRLKLREGGSTYIFATTLADKSHVLLICRKLASAD
jgi:hypothetical protein